MPKTRRRLSKPERLVMFALSEDAARTNADVAERVDMKESTVALHRRNLLKNGHMYFAYLPSLHKLGFEMLAEFFTVINPAIPKESKNDTYKEFFRRNPEVFDAVSGEGFLMASGAFTDVSNLLHFLDRYEEFFGGIHWSRRRINAAVFPFDISRCCFVYNYGPSLNRIMDLGITDSKSRPLERLRRERAAPSKSEARVMAEIIESPARTDSEIARRLRRSRQRIAEIRNDLTTRGLITRVMIPTMISEEFGAIAYVRLRFKPGATLDKKLSIAGEDWHRQSLYTLERDSELFAIYLFSGFREYSTLMNKCIGPFQDAGLFSEEPDMFVIPMGTAVDLVSGSFSPIIRRAVV